MQVQVSMPAIDALILSVLLAYLLGSVPIAALVSRSRRVDIFSTGTGLPGAANVYKQVGRKSGLLVSAGDVAKGALAVAVAARLGIDGSWILLPSAVAILGHWNSIFSRFRGGDGLATLLGTTTVAVPIYGLAAVGVGVITGILFRKSAHPTIRGGFACYFFLLASTVYQGMSMPLTLGIITLGLLVLTHAVIGHHRRRNNAHSYNAR